MVLGTWHASRNLPCDAPRPARVDVWTHLAVQRHEVELEDCNLEDLEEDDGVPAQHLDGPHKVKAVVLELRAVGKESTR